MIFSSSFALQGQHILQALLSGYGAFLSYNAIVRLRRYESTAKKLAEWSNEAANQLHKTRTTQASGALAILASLATSITLTAFHASMPDWAKFGLSPAMLVLIVFARYHIKSYWAPQDGKTVGTRVPLPKMDEYNEAQKQTQDLLWVLQNLEYSWAMTSLFDSILAKK